MSGQTGTLPSAPVDTGSAVERFGADTFALLLLWVVPAVSLVLALLLGGGSS
jgi:hypothetical protein